MSRSSVIDRRSVPSLWRRSEDALLTVYDRGPTCDGVPDLVELQPKVSYSPDIVVSAGVLL